VDGEVYIDNIRLDVGPAPPKNSKAIRVANNLHNKLSWEEPIYQGEADHAVTYRIYRGTDSGFSPTVPVAEVKETAWVDNNIKDRQYFYVIKAVDKLGIEGEASEELVVKKVGIRGVLVYFPIAVILGMLLVN
jgi:fibronectin type 3 domain-containing protein